MAQSTKRLLALLLALMLCVALLPAAALAEEEGTIALVGELDESAVAPAEEPEALAPADGTEEVIASGTCEDGLTWTLYDSGELVISGTGAMKDYKEYDPDHESTYDQVAPWIHYIDRVTSLTVESGITKIGAHAFNGTAINVPSESTLESVSLPETLTSIGSYAFMGSMFREIVFPSSLQSINYRAFSGCHELTEVFFRGSAPTFGTEAFRGDDITAYYPANDDTWTEEVRQNYGGTITWTAYSPSAVVDSGECGDDLTWTLTDDGVLTVTGTGEMWDWGENNHSPWFDYCETITRVDLPNGLTDIGSCAFQDCIDLRSVTIPESVTRIGMSAFKSCSILENVTIPASVTNIGEYAFSGCSLLKTAGPMDGDYNIRFGWTESIPDYAFRGCSSLTSVTIPDGLTSIGSQAFRGCSSLTSVTLPESVTSIGSSAFYYCSSLTSVEIPASVTSIGASAFSSCSSLTSVEIPASVTNIGSSAFSSCSLLKTAGPMDGDYNIRFGWTESIPDSAFYHCSSLTSVEIPDGVTSIGSQAFRNCSSLTNVTLPESLTSIGGSAFSSCSSLTSVTLPESVISIGGSSFSGCSSLTSVTLPASVTNIGSSAFYNCSLLKTAGPLDGDYNIRFGWTESIPDYAFSSCRSLTSITIPDGLTSIGEWAFYQCSSLTSVTLPESLTSIGGYAFCDCSSLSEVYYGGYEKAAERNKGNGWDTWGNDALFNATWYYGKTLEDGWALCGNDLLWQYDSGTRTIAIKGSGSMWDFESNEQPWEEYTGKLVGVNFEPGITTIGKYAFRNCDRLRSVELPEGVTGIGMGAFTNCSSLTNVELPTSLTSIGKEAFHGCSSLTSMELPAGLATIEDSVFYECSSLESVTIPESVTSIGYWAFGNCSSLESVTFPDGLTSIWANAFYNCSGLTSVTLPNGLTSIGNYAFESCSGLTSVTLPEGLTYIGSGAFSGCSSLTSVEFPTGLTSIGDWAFAGCSSLTSVTLPDGVTSIGNSAFYNCSSLTSVTLPDGVTSIGNSAFYNCSSLTSVTIPATVTGIGDYAFYYCSSLKNVVFLGGAPDISGSSFTGVTANAYYPDDGSWWEDDLRDYGGKLTWIPYTGKPMINVFGDVQYGKYYYAPVLWAYYHDPQITKGTDDTHFSPNQTCTRAQIVTFLWNAFGQPEPSSTENPFVDVKPGKYYTKAVLWAVEKGITKGTDATHFGTNDPCSRAQVVTFLWNAYGKPEPGSTDNPFVDVKAGKYYYKAVLWAVEMGITKGVDATHFGVNNTCTRGQVVTFLYAVRDFEKP